MTQDTKVYAAPVVADLGTIYEMTQALAFSGPEDGSSKLMDAHHELISLGSLP